MHGRPVLSFSLILLVFFAAAGFQETYAGPVRKEKTEANQQITPEQARTALAALESLRVITGDEDDPIFVNLKTGEIRWIDESTFTIGKFIFCNLKANTWHMSVANEAAHFFAAMEGKFERHSDGVWRAVRTSGWIT